jgi:hypothetical protein
MHSASHGWIVGHATLRGAILRNGALQAFEQARSHLGPQVPVGETHCRVGLGTRSAAVSTDEGSPTSPDSISAAAIPSLSFRPGPSALQPAPPLLRRCRLALREAFHSTHCCQAATHPRAESDAPPNGISSAVVRTGARGAAAIGLRSCLATATSRFSCDDRIEPR